MNERWRSDWPQRRCELHYDQQHTNAQFPDYREAPRQGSRRHVSYDESRQQTDSRAYYPSPRVETHQSFTPSRRQSSAGGFQSPFDSADWRQNSADRGRQRHERGAYAYGGSHHRRESFQYPGRPHHDASQSCGEYNSPSLALRSELESHPRGPADDRCSKHPFSNHSNSQCFDQQHLFQHLTPISPPAEYGADSASRGSRRSTITPSKRKQSRSPSDSPAWSTARTPSRGSAGVQEYHQQKRVSSRDAPPPMIKPYHAANSSTNDASGTSPNRLLDPRRRSFTSGTPQSSASLSNPPSSDSARLQVPPSYIPETGYYHTNVAGIEVQFTALLKSLSRLYQANISQYDKVTTLVEVLGQIAKYVNPSSRYPRDLFFAFIGITGAGKSWLIGQLLRLPEAVITNDGKRGTHVPTMYKRATEGQAAPYVVQVEYYSFDELWSKLEHDLCNIKAYLTACHDADEAQAEDPDSVESQSALQTQSFLKSGYDASIKTLLSIVYDSNDQDFASTEGLQHLSRGLADDIDSGNAARKQIESRVRAVLRTLDRQPRPARDGGEVWQIVNELSFEKPGFSCRAMLQKIWIRTDESELLRRGLIIADVVGLQDHEHRLSEYTVEILRQSHAVFVVARIQRYTQIKNLREVVQIAMNSGKPTNIVYTHIDQKDKIFADRVEEGAIRDKDLKVIKHRQQTAKQLELEVCRLTEKFQRLDRSGAASELVGNASTELIKAKEASRISDMDLLEAEIQARNREAKLEIQSWPSELLQSDQAPDLDCYFTSAPEHAKYLQHRPVAEALMHRRATGIRQVTEKMCELAGQPKFEALSRSSDTVRILLDGLIATLDRSKQTREAKSKALLCKSLDSFASGLKNLCTIPIDDLLNSEILHAYDQNQMKFADEAKILGDGDGWARSHAATYRAQCSKKGKHRTANAAGPIIPWNAQVQSIMVKDMRPAIDTAQRVATQLQSGAQQEVRRLCVQLKLELASIHDLKDSDFDVIVDACEEQVCASLGEKLTQLSHRIEGFRRSLLSDRSDDSLVGQALKQAYEDAAKVTPAQFRGEGLSGDQLAELRKKGPRPANRAHRERWRIMTQGMTGMDVEKVPLTERLKDKKFMPELRPLIKTNWENMLKDWKLELDAVPATLRQLVMNEFQGRYKVTGEAVIDEESAKALSLLAETARDGFCGPIASMLRECVPDAGNNGK